MSFYKKVKFFLLFFLVYHTTLLLSAHIFIQQLPSGLLPNDFESGWYTQGDNSYFLSREAGIYISTREPVQQFCLKYDELIPSSMPPEFKPVELIPQSLEGHALSATFSLVDSFLGIQPVLSENMGLLTVHIEGADDHYNNRCEIIDAPVLKTDEHFIYFLYAFDPTHLKITPGGIINGDYSFIINDSWQTAGNIYTTKQWILGAFHTSWFEQDTTIKDLFFMINDYPSEKEEATYHFLIDGPYILSVKRLYSDIMPPHISTLYPDMMNPRIELIEKSYREIFGLFHHIYYIIVVLMAAGSIIFALCIYKLCATLHKKVS